MFVDRVRIYVRAGSGGSGCVSFRREKYVPAGGPDGGDGGDGGNVILSVSPRLHTLMDLRRRKHYKAQGGRAGRGKNRHGKNGEDVIIEVPPGTVVCDSSTGDVIADLVSPGQAVVVAAGGRGGKGNARFATATRQAPRFAQPGHEGEERWIDLELKLLADVGFVGLPNVGKSTLLSRISAARPKIADYPFTTTRPHLGVVDLGDGRSFVAADIPGLIEGAHLGSGLGHEFLRHIERTKILVHVIDMAGIGDQRDPVKDFHIVNDEMKLYNPELALRPTIIAGNKIDLPEAKENYEKARNILCKLGCEMYPISAVTGEGVRELLLAIAKALEL
ncbi:MAG: GTPase ObgE [Firmicutes bacterium]|jgi:GTP-binding protein|nr:GTPase ObgE [Bacillota bacterium]